MNNNSLELIYANEEYFIVQHSIKNIPQNSSVIFFDDRIPQKISEQLGLEFISEPPAENRLCYAQSSELREEFKTFFTIKDLTNYVFSFYNNSITTDFIKIPYPTDSIQFWKQHPTKKLK